MTVTKAAVTCVRVEPETRATRTAAAQSEQRILAPMGKIMGPDCARAESKLLLALVAPATLAGPSCNKHKNTWKT